jgi:hypothetical protein
MYDQTQGQMFAFVSKHRFVVTSGVKESKHPATKRVINTTINVQTSQSHTTYVLLQNQFCFYKNSLHVSSDKTNTRQSCHKNIKRKAEIIMNDSSPLYKVVISSLFPCIFLLKFGLITALLVETCTCSTGLLVDKLSKDDTMGCHLRRSEIATGRSATKENTKESKEDKEI